jgi:hemolysin-activating ACP:hemolysin acyltransferase
VAENNGSESAEAIGGADGTGLAAGATAIDPAMAARIAEMRSQVRESFGKIVMAMMMLPRYRYQSVGDLQHLVLEPLTRDRIAIAYPAGAAENPLSDIAGVAVWASVSEEVDADIRAQIKAGTFPIRLKPDAWTSGSINWLLDVIAADRQATTSVIANFSQLVKDGGLRLHPIVTRLVDPETIQKMGATKLAD